jgi:hypothetical protein
MLVGARMRPARLATADQLDGRNSRTLPFSYAPAGLFIISCCESTDALEKLLAVVAASKANSMLKLPLAQASYPTVTLSQIPIATGRVCQSERQRTAVVVEQRRDVALWPILLQKSFWGGERKFYEPLMRFTRGNVRGAFLRRPRTRRMTSVARRSSCGISPTKSSS